MEKLNLFVLFIPAESWAKHPFGLLRPAETPAVVSHHEKRTGITREKYDRQFAREEMDFWDVGGKKSKGFLHILFRFSGHAY